MGKETTSKVVELPFAEQIMTGTVYWVSSPGHSIILYCMTCIRYAGVKFSSLSGVRSHSLMNYSSDIVLQGEIKCCMFIYITV